MTNEQTLKALLRELPPEFDDTAKEAMRHKARGRQPDHESMGGMSDEWIANELRMLSRHDLWHEPFCVAARDRIMRLSMQLAEARGIIAVLKARASENEPGTKAQLPEKYCAICGEHANEHLAIPHQFTPGGHAP